MKHIFAIITLLIALIPTWLFILLYNLLSPVGFWQMLATYLVGFFIFGGAQFIIIVLWLKLLAEAIYD